jgi:hypothetical protein
MNLILFSLSAPKRRRRQRRPAATTVDWANKEKRGKMEERLDEKWYNRHERWEWETRKNSMI